MKIQPLKGTRDFYPKDMAKLNYIFKIWRKVAERYGYQEFDGPMLEPIDLWTAKSGSEIPEQMYRFTDKGNREVAIRPELTPTLARMVAQSQKELSKPIKWYSIPRCWRYESPQSGRLREFFQFNLDALGVESMKADAEVIATAIDIMLELGCTDNDFYVRISNRKLMLSILLSLGIKEEGISNVCRVIDKIDKVSEDDFKSMLKEASLTDKQIKALTKILEADNLKDLEKLKLDEEGKGALKQTAELFKFLEAYGFKKYYRLDLSIMRGLDYYTSTVFEVFDKTKEFRAIAGGGRYDDLVNVFGGERCPGIGYGMGDVVLGLFLNKLNKLPDFGKEVDFYIAAVKEEQADTAMNLAQKLRKKYTVETDIMERKLMKQFEYADKIKAKKVIVIGEKELKEKKVVLKDMVSGKETQIPLDDVDQL
ncbi:histidine--tRNA ligase [Candidatus Woesearchaeota archaeon]|nr:histidine--tRNA ligase [Candidatus Woesearchaeota archaeon]